MTEEIQVDEQKIRGIVIDIWKACVADLNEADYAALRKELCPTAEEEEEKHRIIGIVNAICDGPLNLTGNNDLDEEVLKRLGQLLRKPNRPTITKLNE